ncbi:hypothetical protein IC232_26340 [Microvirga sp. BT688]|uniref:hypothetical protein n=1 Tax=Microvirga sp. TaxID=1873136 RepID=UPI001682A924|nr:hypothetical protein [Microvirga sp.]MBD2750190.1 hypothetical protein [Microvirga sp.]
MTAKADQAITSQECHDETFRAHGRYAYAYSGNPVSRMPLTRRSASSGRLNGSLAVNRAEEKSGREA